MSFGFLAWFDRIGGTMHFVAAPLAASPRTCGSRKGEVAMRPTLDCKLVCVSVLFLGAVLGVAPILPASAQPGDGWTVLLDAENMGDWDLIGETNWRVEDGAVVADNRTSEGNAFLVSKESYEDFMLYVEFWASDDANSGIFFRCFDPAAVTDRTCYEANIFDQREDPTYGTGAIVRQTEVDPMPKAGGKWNTFL
jgi:hypothetical protein